MKIFILFFCILIGSIGGIIISITPLFGIIFIIIGTIGSLVALFQTYLESSKNDLLSVHILCRIVRCHGETDISQLSQL